LKISIATKWHFACPCFPVFEVETSTTYTYKSYQQINIPVLIAKELTSKSNYDA
jgi:hypothetical protein